LGNSHDWVDVGRYGRPRARECGGIQPSRIDSFHTLSSSFTKLKRIGGTMGALLVGIATVVAMLGVMSWSLGGESDAERRRLDLPG